MPAELSAKKWMGRCGDQVSKAPPQTCPQRTLMCKTRLLCPPIRFVRFADVSHLDGGHAAPREGTSADDVADEPQEEAKRKQQVDEAVQWFDPQKL